MGTVKLSLSDRIKRYEAASRLCLPPRTPIIIRVDGKAFHTLTRQSERPFDAHVEAAMADAAIALCEEVQGAQLAYFQSDEISILVHGYKKHDSQAWFDGDIQKIVSISAAVASVAFSAHFGRVGHFDSRAFVVPEADVCNYFLWRQQDATRNSINAMGQSLCSPRELHGKNTSEVQEMIHKRGQNWNDLPTGRKRGRCAVREVYELDVNGSPCTRSRWVIDEEIPIFSRDRAYVERFLPVEDEAAVVDEGVRHAS